MQNGTTTKMRFELANRHYRRHPARPHGDSRGRGYSTVALPSGTTKQTGEESCSSFVTTASDLDCVLAHAAVHLRNSGPLGDWTLGV